MEFYVEWQGNTQELGGGVGFYDAFNLYVKPFMRANRVPFADCFQTQKKIYEENPYEYHHHQQ